MRPPDAGAGESGGAPALSEAPGIEVSAGREATVGTTRVLRILPQRTRRMVGAWCFADHLGPVPTGDGAGGIGPHPHMGLHTVTWLVAGELLHRDSLGSEQSIRPGQLNLMTAGRGVSHAEEPTDGHGGSLHGIQLWVAQPDATRSGPPAFEHHPELPRLESAAATTTVLVGEVGGSVSPARADTRLVGMDVQLRAGTAVVPLAPSFEHGVVVLAGAVELEGQPLTPGNLAYLPPGRDELAMVSRGETRLLVLGGVPFGPPVVMWWNFVGRDRQEMTAASTAWNTGSDRFGETGSSLRRMAAPVPPWAPTDH
jgi:redox-sensitive bicupin YhaK (pirin superfamily)